MLASLSRLLVRRIGGNVAVASLLFVPVVVAMGMITDHDATSGLKASGAKATAIAVPAPLPPSLADKRPG